MVAVTSAARRRATAAAAIGLLPQSSESGNSRGRSLLSFSNDGYGLWGVGGWSFPLL